MFAVRKEEEEQKKCITPNIVYREVLLHRGHQLTTAGAALPSPPTLTVPEHVNDVESIYDGFEEEEANVDLEELYGPRRTLQQQYLSPNLSRPLPEGVIPAVLPSREEAEVDSIAFYHYRIWYLQAALDNESSTAAHEAWLASLPSPSEAPLTPEEVERAAMLQRRSIFMANLRDGSLDGQSIRAAATSANIFTN